MAKNSVDNISKINKPLSKDEYEYILKSVDKYMKQYEIKNAYSYKKIKDDVKYTDVDINTDIIYTKAINQFIKYKPKLKSNDLKLAKVIINKQVENLIKNEFLNAHSKYKSYKNNIDVPLENLIKVDNKEDLENNNGDLLDLFVSKNNEVENNIVFVDSVSYIFNKLNDNEKVLFTFIYENVDEYKWSISRVCKELNITRYEYNKYLKKIQNLCKEVFII